MEAMMSNNKKLIRVTFFGDSICVGQGVSIYNGWVTRIAKDLHEYGKKNNIDIIVTNSSVNGRTTRQALEDMPYHIQSQGVDILVIQFGLNDCNYWDTDRGLPRVSKKAFIANIDEIIDRGRLFGAAKVFLNNNHPTNRNQDYMSHVDFTFEDSNKSYNKEIRNYASKNRSLVSFQDVEASFEGSDLDLMLLDDGLHLSEVGHEKYYNLMAPLLIDAVGQFIDEKYLL